MKSRGSFAALVLTAVLATDAAGAQSQGTSPERTVSRNVVTSEQDPKVRIELPASAQYIGGDRWVLYGIADCELHAFVEPDKQKNVQRLYWIQFEGYLPTRPELHHRYDSVRHTHIGGLDFYVDTWMSRSDAKDEPGSDSEHIQTLIRSKGYRMPAAMMKVRLVHLLDEQKRKELMIIYGEDLASTGFAADELQEGGTAHGQWPKISDGLVERVRGRLSLRTQ